MPIYWAGILEYTNISFCIPPQYKRRPIYWSMHQPNCSLAVGLNGIASSQGAQVTLYLLFVALAGTDNGKDLFISTPNLKSSERVLSTGMLGIRKSPTGVNLNPSSSAATCAGTTAAGAQPASSRSHKRSTSVSISSVTKRAAGPQANHHGSAANSSHHSPGLWYRL